jgi:acetolactate synthase I/II/III large subunit
MQETEMADGQRNFLDGGEAVLEGLRRLKVEYIMSSPGSEMSPIWEALSRQKVSGIAGPGFIDTWHEMVAVDMALGYGAYSGRMPAVFLHAGVGLMHGAMGLMSATASETPMVVMSGESIGFGEQPGMYMEPQWYGGVSVGGADRFIAPCVKKASVVGHPDTLLEQVIRAGELAVREQKGPVYLGVPIEMMIAEWRKPASFREIPPAPKLRAMDTDIEIVAAMIAKAKNPVIVAETVGRDEASFKAMQELANACAIPVFGARSTVTFASFPTSNKLWQGFYTHEQIADADLILLVGGRAPWYPPSRRPGCGKIVSIGDNPIKRHFAYQVLLADHYVEGDMAEALSLIAKAAKPSAKAKAEVEARRTRWASVHDAMKGALAADAKKARADTAISAVALASIANEVLPAETVYIDETITHMAVMRPHLDLDQARSFYRVTGGGLGQGIGVSLGVKLAAKDRPVVLFIGDGSFLYNPIVQAFGTAQEYELPVMVVVCNNSKYAAMRRGHLNYYPGGVADKHDTPYGWKIKGPEYHELGRQFGHHGAKVETVAELAHAFKEALAAMKTGKSAILNVVLKA